MSRRPLHTFIQNWVGICNIDFSDVELYKAHMAKGLTPTDQAIWNLVTRDVTPFGQAPKTPSEGLPVTRVTAPRSIAYNPRVDLHGVTVHEAFGMVQDHIYQGSQNGYKCLLIITGRSGQINLELPRWLEKNPIVRSVKQKENGGSWEIIIKPAI